MQTPLDTSSLTAKQQAFYLTALQMERPITATEMSKVMGMSYQSSTIMCRKLRSKGYFLRLPNREQYDSYLYLPLCEENSKTFPEEGITIKFRGKDKSLTDIAEHIINNVEWNIIKRYLAGVIMAPMRLELEKRDRALAKQLKRSGDESLVVPDEPKFTLTQLQVCLQNMRATFEEYAKLIDKILAFEDLFSGKDYVVEMYGATHVKFVYEVTQLLWENWGTRINTAGINLGHLDIHSTVERDAAEKYGEKKRFRSDD